MFVAVVDVDKNYFFLHYQYRPCLPQVCNSVSFRCDRIGFQYFEGGTHALRRIIFSFINREYLKVRCATIFPFLSLRPIPFFFVLASDLNELHCMSQIRSYRHHLLAVTSRLCVDSEAPGVSGSRRLFCNRKKLSAAENALYILKHFPFLMRRHRRSMTQRRWDRIKRRQQHKIQSTWVVFKYLKRLWIHF